MRELRRLVGTARIELGVQLAAGLAQVDRGSASA